MPRLKTTPSSAAKPQASAARVTSPGTNEWLTMADLLHDLGDVDPARIRARPFPGRATEKDLIYIQNHEKRNYELVDGVLVEKIMGVPESCLALNLSFAINLYLQDNDHGFVVGADGPMRLWKGLVRMPDISYVSWDKMPSKHYPATAIAGVIPNLAVEVLSEGNTVGEMKRKRREYFEAGVVLVWMVDPVSRTVDVYLAPDDFTTLTEPETLDGGTVLPGFALPLRKLFARLPAEVRKKPAKKRKKK